MAKRQRRKPGNIYAIPLPNGTYAFGRLRDGDLIISKYRSTDISDIPDFSETDFFVRVYNDILTDGEWPLVGNIPFKEGEDIYTPPTYIEDILRPGNYEIYYKHEIRKATKEECLGMEVAAVWDREHVVDRLMGIDVWTKICR